MKKILWIIYLKKKQKNIFLLIGIIISGLISREISFIPFFVGDILWGIMIFIIIGIFTNNLKKLILLSLIICFGVEFSQLIQNNIMIEIRDTTLGALILGRGFLYTDLIAYSIGIGISVFIKKLKY